MSDTEYGKLVAAVQGEGAVPVGWQEVRLGEVCKRIGDGLHGTPAYSSNGKYFFVNGSNLKDGKIIITANTKTADYTEFEKYKKELGVKTILLSINGTVGNLAKYNDELCILGKSAAYLNIMEGISRDFVYYLMLDHRFQYDISRNANGSTIKNVSLAQLRDYSFYLPPLPEQKAIAEVLGSLDDKIDLLHRQNKTLEAIAQTLFRKWFVEDVDDGWEEKPLSYFGDVVCGKTPSKKIRKYFGGKIPFIKIPDMQNECFVFDSGDTLTEEGKNSQPNKTIPPKSICVSCIATVGLVSMNAFESQTNQQINSIVPKKEQYRYYIYLYMKFSKTLLDSMANGGTVTSNLNTGNFVKILLPVANDDVFMGFHSKVESLYDKIYANQTQICTLAKLRDMLLPKLVSGKARVTL